LTLQQQQQQIQMHRDQKKESEERGREITDWISFKEPMLDVEVEECESWFFNMLLQEKKKVVT
jgi:hypothetical protein